MSKVYYIKDDQLCHGYTKPYQLRYNSPHDVVLTEKDIADVYRDFLNGRLRGTSQRFVFEKDMIDSGQTTSQGLRIYYYMGKVFSGKTKKEASLKASAFVNGLYSKKHEIYSNQTHPNRNA